VADTGNSTIRKITAAGVVTTLAGRALATGSVDGNGTTARFKNPMSIAVDGPGTLYVADTFNHTIRKITPAGVVSTLAGTAGVSGSVDGTGAAARFNSPNSVAVDNAGNVYVADTYNNTVRKITQAGEVTTLAGRAGVSGSVDGTGAGAAFSSPDGVAVDSAGNLYVTDAGNNTVRKVTPAGVVTTLAGALKVSDSADGVGASAHFVIPYGVAVDTAGGLYVTDVGGSTIRKITPAGEVSTFAGTAAQAGSVDGSGAAARFFNPYGVAADGDGNLYAADEVNGTIRKITPAGVASTLAGTARVWGGADGTGAAASFYTPYGVAADSAGNVYVADTSNSTIRKVISAGVVTTLAGTADQVGSADGTGSAARFTYPMGVAVDGAGNLYVADTWNSTIRKVSPAGVVTTLAGGPGLIGHVDGTATEARFNKPTGVAVDSAGNVYVADSSDHTIRKVTPEGVVTTLAGLAGFAGGSDGLGTGAQFNAPTGVAVDGAGNVYVADSQNYAIRKISPGGMVTTVIGTLLVGGFRPGDLPGVIGNPYGVAISGNRVYLSSYNAILVAIFVP
jgi:sugar lactone lactonase YvrE